MRVVAAFILALAAGVSGVPGPCDSAEDDCKEDPYCMWVDSCGGPIRRNLRFGPAVPDRRNLRFGPAVPDRRKLRFGAAETGCCVPLCGPARRLTAEEMAALSPEQLEARRRLC